MNDKKDESERFVRVANFLIRLAEAGAAVLIPTSNNESHHHHMCYGLLPHAVSMYMMPR